jgi:chemotaxis protein methyltransferase CheR
VGGMKDLLLQYLGRPYLWVGRRIWRRLPASVRSLPPVRLYGMQLHALVQQLAPRRQNHSTFFFRNRSELELIRRLVDRKVHGSSLDISIVACSKGAEVYSFAWTIRSARPDLKLTVHAIDISEEIVEFAKEGAYSLRSPDVLNGDKLAWNTHRDQGPRQNVSIFERMTEREMNAIFDREGDQVTVKSWLKEGIIWHPGDANDPELVNILGPQDIVVANRFLCHMEPVAAEQCLRGMAHLVKPGGYLLVSGVDLDVRTKVAREMGWRPVTDLIREIHEGDVSLMNDWPLEYWTLEPFQPKRRDCLIRYASAFQVGVPS